MSVDPLDPVLHQPARLRIMVALYKNRQLGFPALRDELELTPGNLGAHLEKLETAGYLLSARVLSGTSFEMRYAITPRGSGAFRAYLAALRGVLADADAISGASSEPASSPSPSRAPD